MLCSYLKNLIQKSEVGIAQTKKSEDDYFLCFMNTLYIFKLIFNWISLNISGFSECIKNVIFDSGTLFHMESNTGA